MAKTNADDGIVSQIRRHSRQLVRELDVVNGCYLDSGLTLSQCHVMFEISNHGALNLVELSEHLLIDKSNTSRTVKQLVNQGLAKSEPVPGDQRQKLFSLTSKGEKVLERTSDLAQRQVNQALCHLTPTQQQTVVDGLKLYAGALRKSRCQKPYSIRLIQKKDDAHVARIIREVMTEFNAVGVGYSINDPEVDEMYSTYRGKRSCYYVIESEGKIFGGGGIAPLTGGEDSTCELQKMFFLPAIRGLGFGHRLLQLLLDQACRRGYKRCYLETLDRMWQANELYKKNGFRLLEGPQGNTGHCSCDCWYAKDLVAD